MLVLIGTQMSDSTVTGYRVMDLSVSDNNQSIQCSGVRTVDTYQILQLLYTTDPQTGAYYRFANAELWYSMDKEYKLVNENENLVWVHNNGNCIERKVISNYSAVDASHLSLKPVQGSIFDYGLYPEQGTPYVVLAVKYDAHNRPVSYFVVDAAFETGKAIEQLNSSMFLSKVRYRAEHYRHEGVANGRIGDNDIFEPYGAVVMLRDPTAVATNGTLAVSELGSRQRSQDAQQRGRGLFGRGSTASTASSTSPMPQPAVEQSANTTLAVPTSVHKLENGILLNQMLLEVLKLHSGVQAVEPHALLGCPNFKRFEVDSGNVYMCSPGGLLLSKNCAELIRCPPRVETTITCIPTYTKVIKAGAFRGVLNLEEIIIPPNVEIIEPGAFVDCPNLRKVIIFAKTVMEDILVDCPNLETLILAKGVETIEGTLVRNCPRLSFLIFPDTLQSIRGKTYAEWLPNGISSTVTMHKLIERTPIRLFFAPVSVVSCIQELYTDVSMYDTSKGKKFMFLQSTESNLRQYQLGDYLKYIR